MVDQNYVKGVCTGFLYVFLVASVSLCFDLAFDAGFNAFEVEFCRGFIAFIGTFCYDIIISLQTFKNIHIGNNNGASKTYSNDNNTPNWQQSTDSTISESETECLIADHDHGHMHDVSKTTDKQNPSLAKFWQLTYIYYVFHLNDQETWHSILYLYLRGLLRSLNIACFYISLTQISLGDSMTVHNTSPIWGVLIEKYFFNSNSVYWGHYIVILLAIIGVLFMSQPSFLIDYINFNSHSQNDNYTTSETIIGYTSGLLSGILQALSFAGMRKFIMVESRYYNSTSENNINININVNGINRNDLKIIFAGMYSISFNFAIVGIIGSFIMDGEFFYESVNENDFHPKAWLYAFLVGIVSTFAMYFLNYSLGVGKVNVNEMSLIALTEVIWAFIFQIMFLNQNIDYWDIIGVVCIIIPVAFMFVYNIYSSS